MCRKPRSVAVLASGDPNFYGIAQKVMEQLGPDRVILHPNVTTVGSAFARLKETWAEAGVVSLHGRGESALYQALIDFDKVAVYTDRRNTPGHIATLMIERGQSNWRIIVLENLGLPEEIIREMSLDEAAGIGIRGLESGGVETNKAAFIALSGHAG
jgi:precorrin-6Y C5,15-methyltransferase (decarboxylating)